MFDYFNVLLTRSTLKKKAPFSFFQLKKNTKMSMSQIADFSNGTSKTFVFQGEGHTLGNALKGIISSYPNVQFCGYTVPHPAENKMHLRIQVFRGQAIDALKKGLEDLIHVCDITLEKFDAAVVSFNAVDKTAV